MRKLPSQGEITETGNGTKYSHNGFKSLSITAVAISVPFDSVSSTSLSIRKKYSMGGIDEEHYAYIQTSLNNCI